jgi:hypothetical protein
MHCHRLYPQVFAGTCAFLPADGAEDLPPRSFGRGAHRSGPRGRRTPLAGVPTLRCSLEVLHVDVSDCPERRNLVARLRSQVRTPIWLSCPSKHWTELDRYEAASVRLACNIRVNWKPCAPTSLYPANCASSLIHMCDPAAAIGRCEIALRHFTVCKQSRQCRWPAPSTLF